MIFLFIVCNNLYCFSSSGWRDGSSFQWKQLFEYQHINNESKWRHVTIDRDHSGLIEQEHFCLQNDVLVAGPSDTDYLTSCHEEMGNGGERSWCNSRFIWTNSFRIQARSWCCEKFQWRCTTWMLDAWRQYRQFHRRAISLKCFALCLHW